MKKWILFDVDDVLVNFRQSLADACRAIGRDIPWIHWTSYKHTEIYGFPTATILREFMRDSKVLENALIEPHVREVLQLLHTRGYSIGLITARGWHPSGDIITRRMVSDNKLLVDKIVVSQLYTDKKSNFLHEFEGEIVAFLDDSSHHVKDFLEHQINAYVLDMPWNTNDIELPRVHSILQFLEEVIRLEPSLDTAETDLTYT